MILEYIFSSFHKFLGIENMKNCIFYYDKGIIITQNQMNARKKFDYLTFNIETELYLFGPEINEQ